MGVKSGFWASGVCPESRGRSRARPWTSTGTSMGKSKDVLGTSTGMELGFRASRAVPTLVDVHSHALDAEIPPLGVHGRTMVGFWACHGPCGAVFPGPQYHLLGRRKTQSKLFRGVEVQPIPPRPTTTPLHGHSFHTNATMFQLDGRCRPPSDHPTPAGGRVGGRGRSDGAASAFSRPWYVLQSDGCSNRPVAMDFTRLVPRIARRSRGQRPGLLEPTRSDGSHSVCPENHSMHPRASSRGRS